MAKWKQILGAGLAVALAGGSASAQDAWHPSRYGADDVLGALNNLSPEGVKRAVSLVKTGKVYSLAIPTGPEGPAYGERKYASEISPAPGQEPPPIGPNRITAYDEKVTTSMGIGTQMDGFGHLGIDHRYYNGLPAKQLNTPDGFKMLDFSNRPPIVTRGVVIDMVKHFGEPLEAGQVFNRPEIEAAMKAQGIKVGKGDVVLFHTGWMHMIQLDKAKYSSSEPGIGVGGATWLADLGVVAIGADTIALEALPPPSEDQLFAVHQTLLAKKGVHILENVNTEPLIKDGVKEFLFVLGQPRFVGTVQVVVNPVAIH